MSKLEEDIQKFKINFEKGNYDEIAVFFKELSLKDRLYFIKEIRIFPKFSPSTILDTSIHFCEKLAVIFFEERFGIFHSYCEENETEYDILFKERIINDFISSFFLIDSKNLYKNEDSYINFKKYLHKKSAQEFSELDLNEIFPDFEKMNFHSFFNYISFFLSRDILYFNRDIHFDSEKDILMILNYFMRVPSEKVNQKLMEIDFSFICMNQIELIAFLRDKKLFHIFQFLIEKSYFNAPFISLGLEDEFSEIVKMQDVARLKKAFQEYHPAVISKFSYQYATWVKACFLKNDNATLKNLLHLNIVKNSVEEHNVIFEDLNIETYLENDLELFKIFINYFELTRSQSYQFAKVIYNYFLEKEELLLSELMSLSSIRKIIKNNRELFKELPLKFYIEKDAKLFELLLKIETISILPFENLNNASPIKKSVLLDACEHGDERFLRLVLRSPYFNLADCEQSIFMHLYQFHQKMKEKGKNIISIFDENIQHTNVQDYYFLSDYVSEKSCDKGSADLFDLNKALEEPLQRLNIYHFRRELLLHHMCAHGLLDLLILALERTKLNPFLEQMRSKNLLSSAISHDQFAVISYLLKINIYSSEEVLWMAKKLHKPETIKLFLSDENFEKFKPYLDISRYSLYVESYLSEKAKLAYINIYSYQDFKRRYFSESPVKFLSYMIRSCPISLIESVFLKMSASEIKKTCEHLKREENLIVSWDKIHQKINVFKSKDRLNFFEKSIAKKENFPKKSGFYKYLFQVVQEPVLEDTVEIQEEQNIDRIGENLFDMVMNDFNFR